MERVVVALGGNALLRRDEQDTFEIAFDSARRAAEKVADIAAGGWEVVVTRGNGPRVGRILLQQESARGWVHPMPHDVCGAWDGPMARSVTSSRSRSATCSSNGGWSGRGGGPDPDPGPGGQPGVREPHQAHGPFYEEDEAKNLAAERGYAMRPDPHGGFRRVVPSRAPYSIVEAPVIRALVADGVLVIASGGSGVSVIEQGPRLVGVEGVVDKDLAAAILAPDRLRSVQLRVVVYNVRGFRDRSDRVIALVARFRPDLVMLNETGTRRRLRRFARVLGMDAATDPWSPLRRRVKNAVLVRPPWRIVSRRLHRFKDVRRRLYPRGALIAQVGRSGLRMWAIAAHLGLHPLERIHSVEEISDLARGLAGPVLIGGDFNEPPDGKAVAFLAKRYWDAWLLGGDVSGETFPASDPTARIDFLFLSEGVGVMRVIVPPGPDARLASDHLPVVAELRLPEPESPPDVR